MGYWVVDLTDAVSEVVDMDTEGLVVVVNEESKAYILALDYEGLTIAEIDEHVHRLEHPAIETWQV